jgi:hypothetical protein
MKFSFTPGARKTDPETSHEAADSVYRPSQTAIAVFFALYGHELTDEQLFHKFEGHAHEELHPFASPQSVRSRRAELMDAGIIEWSGEYGLTRFGRKCRVWKVVDGFKPETIFATAGIKVAS